MEEKAGLLKTLEVLGSKVIDLENDLSYERLCKDQAAREVERLRAENAALGNKLGEVKQYIKVHADGMTDA